MVMVPSSAMSIVVPVSSVSARMVAPPLPITSRIFSGLIFMVYRRGRELETSVFAPPIASTILPRMCMRASFGLGQRHLHDLLGDALDLDVHLQGGHAVGGAGHLEVHVAEVILVAEDVGQHGETVASLIRPIAMPATCAFIGTPASISAGSRRRPRPSTTSRSTR